MNEIQNTDSWRQHHACRATEKKVGKIRLWSRDNNRWTWGTKTAQERKFRPCAVRRTPAGRGRYIFARMDAEGTDGYPFHYHDRICLSTGCCTSHKTGSQRLSGKTGTDGRIAKTTERYFPSQICDMRQEQVFAPQKQPSDAGGRTSGQYSRPIWHFCAYTWS